MQLHNALALLGRYGKVQKDIGERWIDVGRFRVSFRLDVFSKVWDVRLWRPALGGGYNGQRGLSLTNALREALNGSRWSVALDAGLGEGFRVRVIHPGPKLTPVACFAAVRSGSPTLDLEPWWSTPMCLAGDELQTADPLAVQMALAYLAGENVDAPLCDWLADNAPAHVAEAALRRLASVPVPEP